MLTVASVVSLAVGIWEDYSANHPKDEPRIGWYITLFCPPFWYSMMTIVQGGWCCDHYCRWSRRDHQYVKNNKFCLYVLITHTHFFKDAINDYEKEKQFRKLNAKKEDRPVKVSKQDDGFVWFDWHTDNKALRGGVAQQIPVREVVVGDILFLEPGDMITVDAVYLEGFVSCVPRCAEKINLSDNILATICAVMNLLPLASHKLSRKRHVMTVWFLVGLKWFKV